MRNQPAYRNTEGWHFLNLPLGLDYAAFRHTVKTQDKENVYTAMLKQQQVLTDKGSSSQQKQEALKLIIHFVGDAHQPMHISRAEDKGGNTIQVQFDGKGTNLHSLWDGRLLDKQGKDEVELVKLCDNARPADIAKLQKDDLLQ